MHQINRIVFRRQIENIHGMREIITCYADSRGGRGEGNGYPDLKICKDHSPGTFSKVSRGPVLN